MTSPTFPPRRYKEPTPVDIDAYRASLPQPAGPAVAGPGETDDVLVSAVVYQNRRQRRSLSVHHTQRRLAELGYPTPPDPAGYYGEGTRGAMRSFQDAHGFPGDGLPDAATLAALFTGDPNVTLINDQEHPS